jgi:hypothetical protein
MLRKLIIGSILLLFLAIPALAQTPPPAHGGHLAGWGMNPNDWDNHTGSFNSGTVIYDPLYLGGGLSWVVGYDGAMNPIYLVYTPITMELWIEMYMIQTYEHTSYQWHRIGNHAEHICFLIQGLIKSNNGQYVSLTWDGTDPLTHLYFRENIFGSPTPGPGCRDIPITWRTRWGNGLVYGVDIQQTWTVTTPDPHDITMLIPDPCDHWYEFEGCFDLEYHECDGYYSLTSAGCPAPVF